MNRLGDVRPLIEWRGMIGQAQASEVGFAELLAFLREDREYAGHLKSCTPFPGVLDDEELDRFACAWTR